MIFLRLLLPLLIILLVAVLVLRLVRSLNRPKPKPAVKKKTEQLSSAFDRVPPQQAAVTMMIGIARETGSITEAERDQVFSIMADAFQVTGDSAERLYYKSMELYAKARNLSQLLGNLCPVINRDCSYNEKRQLHEMLVKVASADGKALTSKQNEALRLLEEYLEIGRQGTGT